MGIIRVKKGRGAARYFVAANEPFTNRAVSWEARGLLAYLLSRPDGWTIQNADLLRQGPAGRDKLSRMLRELKEAGYLVRTRYQNEDGTFSWESFVFESPDLSAEYIREMSEEPGQKIDDEEGDDDPEKVDNTSTMNGLSVDGSAVDGSAVDGSAVDGKPVDICITEKVITETRKNGEEKIFSPLEEKKEDAVEIWSLVVDHFRTATTGAIWSLAFDGSTVADVKDGTIFVRPRDERQGVALRRFGTQIVNVVRSLSDGVFASVATYEDATSQSPGWNPDAGTEPTTAPAREYAAATDGFPRREAYLPESYRELDY